MKWSTILRRLQGGGTTRAIKSWRELSRSRNVSFWHEVPGLIGNGSSSSTALPESVSNIDRIEKIWKAMRATALVAWDRTLMATFSTRSRKTSCPSAITRACISMALPAWGSCFSRGVRIWTNSSRFLQGLHIRTPRPEWRQNAANSDESCVAEAFVAVAGRTFELAAMTSWRRSLCPSCSCLTIIWIYKKIGPGSSYKIGPKNPYKLGGMTPVTLFLKPFIRLTLKKWTTPPGLSVEAVCEGDARWSSVGFSRDPREVDPFKKVDTIRVFP